MDNQLISSNEPTKNNLCIFTDGSNIGKDKGGFAVYIEFAKVLFGRNVAGTNNFAELMAIKVALFIINKGTLDEEFLKDNKIVYICSDSMYSINAIAGVNKVVANQQLINDCKILLNKCLEKCKIEFYHVKAHTNNRTFVSLCNKLVDETARECATKEKKIIKTINSNTL